MPKPKSVYHVTGLFIAVLQNDPKLLSEGVENAEKFGM